MANNAKRTHSDRSIRKARKQRRDHSTIVPLRVSIADMARIIRSDHGEGRSDG